jgi:hypothetical protein
VKKGALCHQALFISLSVVFWLPRLSNDLPARFEQGSDPLQLKRFFSPIGKKRGYSGGTATDLDRVPLPTNEYIFITILSEHGNVKFLYWDHPLDPYPLIPKG